MLVETGSVIPKGYIVSFTTWENDGDYYKTITNTGLTRNQAKFLIEVSRLFKSSSKHYGNEEYSELIIDDIKEIFSQFDDGTSIEELFDFDLFDEDLDEEEVLYFLQEKILGVPVEYEYDFCRVVESVKVQVLEEDFVVPEIKIVDIETL